MGFFSDLFRKKRTWQEFQGQENSDSVLRGKAAAFAPVLLHLTVRQAATLKDVVINAGEQIHIDNFFFEWIAVSIHITERAAVRLLSAAASSKFSSALRQEMIAQFLAFQPPAGGVQNARQLLEDLMEKRGPDYADYDVQPRPNERGGFDIRQSIGWRFSENVGISNPAVSLMLIESIMDQVKVLEAAELPQLLVGYS
jgi:hypothetical protein